MIDLESIEAALSKVERKLERRIGEAKAIVAHRAELKAEIDELKLLQQACEEAVGVLNSFADERAAVAQRQIEALVTHGLQTVFGEDLSFHIVNTVKAKRNETEFVVRSNYGGEVIETPIMDARGGGVAAVAGFLLRLIVILLRPDVRRTLFLDETFAHVSEEYEPRVVEFVKELVSKTDVQIVLVTHSGLEDWLDAADKAYSTSLVGGKTVLKQLT